MIRKYTVLKYYSKQFILLNKTSGIQLINPDYFTSGIYPIRSKKNVMRKMSFQNTQSDF